MYTRTVDIEGEKEEERKSFKMVWDVARHHYEESVTSFFLASAYEGRLAGPISHYLYLILCVCVSLSLCLSLSLLSYHDIYIYIYNAIIHICIYI